MEKSEKINKWMLSKFQLNQKFDEVKKKMNVCSLFCLNTSIEAWNKQNSTIWIKINVSACIVNGEICYLF